MDCPDGENRVPLFPAPISLAATLWIVLLTALAVRAVILVNALELFPLEPLHFRGSDQGAYLEWARQLAGGDWLALDRGPLYFSPLAPYLAGLTFALLHTDSLWGVVAWNTLAGCSAALFAALLARRLFSPAAGVWAGLLLALNGAQIALEGLLLNDPLVPALLLGGLWCAVEIRHRHGAARPVGPALALTGGLLLGGAILARSSNLLPALALWGGLAWLPGRGPRLPWRTTLLPMLFPIMVLTALPVLYNGGFHGQWSLTVNGPFNFYVGNSKLSTGVFDMTAEVTHGSQPSEFWSARLRQELAEDPGLLPRNLAWKTQLLVNAWVAPDNWNYYFSRHQIPALAHFSLDPLALHLLGWAGLFVTWGQRRKLGEFYLFLAAFSLSIILVFVSGRYKLPLHGLLAVLAGGGMAGMWEAWRQKNRTRLLAGCAALLVALPLSLPRAALSISAPALFPLRTNDYYNIALSLHQAGMKDRVVALLEPFLEESPVFSSESAVLLATLLIERERFQPAARLMERALQDTQAPPAIRRLWMEIRLQALANYADDEVLGQAIRELLVVAPGHPFGKLLEPGKR